MTAHTCCGVPVKFLYSDTLFNVTLWGTFHSHSVTNNMASPILSHLRCTIKHIHISQLSSCPGTYLLTPWCRVLLEQQTCLHLVKKFPAFHGTRRFITALTSVRHLSLSWASPIQSIYPYPTFWRSIVILSTHLRLGLPSGLFPSGFPTKTLYTPLSSPTRSTCPAHLILLDFISRKILREQYKSFSSSLCNLLHSPVTSSLLGPNTCSGTERSNSLFFKTFAFLLRPTKPRTEGIAEILFPKIKRPKRQTGNSPRDKPKHNWSYIYLSCTRVFIATTATPWT